MGGVDNDTHEIVGTRFNQHTLKKGEEEIESGLRRMLSPNANFMFSNLLVDNKPVVVIIICSAVSQTVMFEKVDYIRIGSYTKKLNDNPSVKAQLWDNLRNTNYELMPAATGLNKDDVVRLLDVGAYFELKGEPPPTSIHGMMHYLSEENIIIRLDNGLYSISNMGALLFARRIDKFSTISRKAVRIIQYEGINRLNMLREETETRGYALGFEGLLKFIMALTPAREAIEGAQRQTETAYPMVAIREAVANALIHQNFNITGTGTVIEVFKNRIEITNPGVPLVDIERIIDNPPKSRNEKLATLMRRMKMCEELGTGWDKIAISCEIYKLPAPSIEIYEENTKVTLYQHIPFSDLSLDQRIGACYLHACILQVEGRQLTNSSLRERFGLGEGSAAGISRLIKETVERGYIKPLDPETAPRYMKYIPIWA